MRAWSAAARVSVREVGWAESDMMGKMDKRIARRVFMANRQGRGWISKRGNGNS